FSGSDFTSARLKTKDKFEFQYGRVEMRAKLPTGGGTWPAFWMLGADIDSNPWPGAGEIDIMEHVGNEQDRIYSTLHFPGNSGGDSIGSSTIISDVSEEFHVYEANWTANSIEFSVDGNVFYVFDNDPALPFNKDFFLLINVAMGGNFGGTIDPAFEMSTLEVDYIRVYQ
ncbi:MAG: glycoside hydrolase family 16 protein, partial [Flavobacteriaceae bacterium]|nr:glycoside hydrolase family 16 protein [Flavobacteriaceae bacterium]